MIIKKKDFIVDATKGGNTNKTTSKFCLVLEALRGKIIIRHYHTTRKLYNPNDTLSKAKCIADAGGTPKHLEAIKELHRDRVAPIKAFDKKLMVTCSDIMDLEKRILFFQELGDTGGIYLIQYKYDLNIYYIGRTIKFKNRFRSHIKQHKSTDRFHLFATIVGWDSFNFSVIEICSSEQQGARENWYLQEYLPLLNTNFYEGAKISYSNPRIGYTVNNRVGLFSPSYLPFWWKKKRGGEVLCSLQSMQKKFVIDSNVDKTNNNANNTNKTFKSVGGPGPIYNNLNIITRNNTNNRVRSFFCSAPLRKRKKGVNIGYKPRFYSTMRGCSSKLWVDYSVFNLNDLDKFKKDIFYSGKIEVGVEYSVIFKIRKGDIYYMLGTKQKKVVFNSYDDEYFEELFELIQDRLQLLFEEYTKELEYECDTILLDFWAVNVDKKLKISNFNEVRESLSKAEFEIVKKGFNYFGNSLMDVKGKPLVVSSGEGKLDIEGIENIPNMVKFPEKFLEKAKSNEKIYHLDKNSKCYVITYLNKHFFIVLDKISEKEVDKRCFNKFGDLISSAKDVRLENGNLQRESGNYIAIFNSNNEIIYTERKIKFDSIKNDFKSKEEVGLPNSNIGVLDLETYEDGSIAHCYAIGFKSSIDDGCKTYYIDKDLDSTKLIHLCINEMLRPKYKDMTFYVHNLGKFDAPFIIKALTIFNKSDEGIKNPYTLDVKTRNSDILKLIIKRKVEDKVRMVKIQDSVAILPRSLRDLCFDYKVEVFKGYFPYLFCTKSTLFYKGKTPDISYYKDIPLSEYKDLYKEVWDLEKECIVYLEKDLLSLYEVLVKVNKAIHFLFDIQMTECLTISGISMKIFLTKYYDSKKKAIPLIINKAIFEDIHSAYYGGRVEVYNPIIDGIAYYYDINSLYPFASLNAVPGVDCAYVESINQKIELANLFGFFYCKVKTTQNYLGLLPVRTKTGGLIFPVGEWEGWYFSEELKYALENGFEIEVVRGYKFKEVTEVFNKFVEDIYKIKSNPRNDTEKNVSKLILNSLIGRFGMDYLKMVTNLVNKETHNHISITRILRNYIEIDENTYLDTYKPNIDKEVCDDFGVDFVEALNAENFKEINSSRTYRSVSITTAAAVLSYARRQMAKIKLYILNNGGTLYYTDTDSIVTDLKLPDEFVDPKAIGKLKLEHIITEGYFITDKTYAFKTEEGKLIKIAKGVKSSSLEYEDYKKMYNMEIIENVAKTSSYRNYKDGSVIIKDEKVKLNPTLYSKRQRVFEKGKWVATKPIVITKDSKN